MHSTLTIVIESVLYLMLASGVSILLFKDKKRFYQIYRGKGMRRLKKAEKRDINEYAAAVEDMLTVVTGRNIGFKIFVSFSVLISVSVFLPALRAFGFVKASWFAVAAGIMPLILLRLKYMSRRVKGSFEGEHLVSALLASYRLKGFNMAEAIEELVRSNKDLKFTRVLMFRLLTEIRSADSDKEIEMAVKKFSDAVNTSWSRMMALNIRIGCTEGTNMTLGMEEILKQLREAKLLQEERKRMNSESVRMTVFLIPITYIVIVFMSVKNVGMSIGELMYNQFCTDIGLMLFFLISGMFIANLAVMDLVLNRKFDI